MQVVIKERPLPDGSGMARVTADDTSSFLAKFQNGAQGAFLATRLATGRKNFLRLEVFGTRGSFIFNLERLNELEYYALADAPAEQGFRTILATDGGSHPYIKNWWPHGHIIGWEHTFIHEVADFLTAVGAGQPVQPDFYDGLRCQQVLDAMVQSSASGRWVAIPAGE
jgi:predicted dehydrogenase